MHYTPEQVNELRARAVEAVRALWGRPGDGQAQPERDAAAEKAVTEAVRAGVHHRQIAEQAGTSGLLVLRCITDPALSNIALIAERHHAERYVEQIMEEIRGRALWLCRHDVSRTDVCAALGISRPALNAWIRADSTVPVA